MIEITNIPTTMLVITVFNRAPQRWLRNSVKERKKSRKLRLILRIFDPPGVLRTLGLSGKRSRGRNLRPLLSQRKGPLDNIVFQRQNLRFFLGFWEVDGKGSAFPEVGGDGNFAAVQERQVLHNRQSQAGSAHLTRPCTVDSVETFE